MQYRPGIGVYIRRPKYRVATTLQWLASHTKKRQPDTKRDGAATRNQGAERARADSARLYEDGDCRRKAVTKEETTCSGGWQGLTVSQTTLYLSSNQRLTYMPLMQPR